jgi:hypothetical protein
MFRFCGKGGEFVSAFTRKLSPQRSINFKPDETKVAEQDRGKCFEAQATDWHNNQPFPAEGKNVFLGKVRAGCWVNALQNSKSRLTPVQVSHSASRVGGGRPKSLPSMSW